MNNLARQHRGASTASNIIGEDILSKTCRMNTGHGDDIENKESRSRKLKVKSKSFRNPRSFNTQREELEYASSTLKQQQWIRELRQHK